LKFSLSFLFCFFQEQQQHNPGECCLWHKNEICIHFFSVSVLWKRKDEKISSCTFEVNAFAISADVSFLTANDFFILNFSYVYAKKKTRTRKKEREGM
jgi:hypothetical protein